MLGSSALGALGSAFGGEDDGLSSEQKRLLEAQAVAQEKENMLTQQATGPADVLKNRVQMDMMLSQYGPIGELARMGLMALNLVQGGVWGADQLAQTAQSASDIKGNYDVLKGKGQGGGFKERALTQMRGMAGRGKPDIGKQMVGGTQPQQGIMGNLLRRRGQY